MGMLHRWVLLCGLGCSSLMAPFLPSPIASLKAQPFVPGSNDTVLLALPAAVQEYWQQQQTAAVPTAAERIARARRLLATAQSSGNQDAWGQAEALLHEPFAAEGALALEAAYLLAYVRQHNHDFASALQLLNEVLRQQPRHAAARLQRMQIQLVTANHAAARADCEALVSQVGTALLASCIAQVDALTGRITAAYELMQRMLADTNINDGDRIELQTTAATIAEQLGQTAEAQHLYNQLLQTNPANRFALQHLASSYLQSGEAGKALALLQSVPAELQSLEQEVTLLQALLANGNTQQAAELQIALADKFAAARARGPDGSPDKELALYLLATRTDPLAAVAAARRNWNLQKEPGDLLLLAATARFAGDTTTLATVRSWLHETGLQDKRIDAVLQDAPP